ncbi:MAG: PSD1 domain-containing protein [Verrucomicrobia bacterium]|nr:PSD1 domain-containing protein [Verrucomicrobiota bacterium]
MPSVHQVRPTHRFLSLCAALFPFALSAATVDFARDVLPILQRACFECHDAKLQKGKLRLDSATAAFQKPGIIVPGKSAQSELVRRISLPKGHEDVMPSRGESLSKTQVSILKAWIEAGATWPDDVKAAKHWAYVKPVRPAVPSVQGSQFQVQSPVDAFIFARLRKEGLRASPEASPEILARRIHLDLIGLPPTPAEVDGFVRDYQSATGNRQPAIAKLADRLLASPQFGVRWARPWLDYARYADSHGFQRDDFRDLWPYRDWVVNALNSDMPFTQFTIEQLAGDLLPNATESQRIATGFNRSAPTNVEAGTDPEETRVNQVHDRVSTLGTVWLGSTFDCAQCHDHKYDPFTQRDYYGLFAFFNNTELEADRTNPKVPGSIQFKGPVMELADSNSSGERHAITTRIATVTGQLAALEKTSTADQAAWETTMAHTATHAAQEHVFDIADFDSTGGATHELLPDKSVLISGEPAPDKDTYLVEVRTKLTAIRAIKLETLTHDSLPGKGPGRGDAARPNFVLNNFTVTAAPDAQPGQAKPVKFAAAKASFSQSNFPVPNLLNPENTTKGGWAINPRFHEPHWAVLETTEPLGFIGGTLLRFKLEQNFGAGRTIGRLRLSAITGSVGGAALPGEVAEALKVPLPRRTAKQAKALSDFRLKDNPEHARLEKEKSRLEADLLKLKPPTTLVMREVASRMSTVFQRGEFRTPGDKVEPHTPTVLHQLKFVADDVKSHTSKPSSGQSLLTPSPTRLDLAQWLVSRENPLVARVAVNRWWAELFGHGLVTTPEDFGIKGEPPTHSELLDWLAVEFMDNGWSMKKLLKTIVTSAAYRQSSRVTLELFARDDQNLLYARGPRHRLDAEMVRDNALGIAGLLSLKQGGPPIQPYQPDGLWVKVGGQRYDYIVSPGEERYRRGLYVIWKRGAPYPSFVNFDANSRMACRVKRPQSNTPLQALTLMNDPVHVEAAMAFARRVIVEKASAADRLTHAFRLATSRAPRADELATLTNLLGAARSSDAKSARDFVGKFELPAGVTAEEFAAWYAVATALLNLDETITKG